MSKNDYLIRLERKEDHREVENLIRESFWNVYRPGCLEHYVINQLRNDDAFIHELDFVMEKDGKIIGQNMFMKANIKADSGKDIPILTTGPICITPELKRQGYGKILLDYSLEKATELGFGALCFEGNINFYGKSGFSYASEFGIRYHGLPEDADASFFLCKELIAGFLNNITGEYTPPQGYFVDETEAQAVLAEYPYFRLSSFEKSYPKRLIINVTENAEIYAIEKEAGKQYLILGSDGTLLEIRDSYVNALNGEENVLLKGVNVSGVFGTIPAGDDCFATMLAMCQSFSEKLDGIRRNVVSIEVMRRNPEVLFKVTMREGVVIYFNTPAEYTEEKVSEAIRVYQSLKQEEKLTGRIYILANNGEILSQYSPVDEFHG